MINKKVDAISKSAETYDVLIKPTLNNPITRKQYRTIIVRVLEEIMKGIITTGRMVTMPTSFGCFQAVKFRTKKHRPVDFKSTSEYGKTIRHTNKGTNGYWTKIHWYKKKTHTSKYGANYRNSGYFSFRPSRCNLRPTSNGWARPAEVTLYHFFKEEGWKFYKQKT